jgi:hypothetical protein
MPLPNDPQAGDRYNTQGFLTPVPLPLTSNFYVVRVDHDFGQNWRFMGSYRYYKFNQYTSNQVDIGGILPGDTFGVAAAKTQKPQTPSYIVTGLTGVITPHLINDLHFSYLRNAWAWYSAGAPSQLPGLGGAFEVLSDNSNALIPFPVDRGDGLARFWDGQDKVLRDDLTWIKGNHQFQFGGQYYRGNYKHQRNDNGSSIMSSIVYQINSGAGIFMPSSYIPSGVPANQLSNYSALYASVLGMVAQSQVFYARKNGQLLPIGSSISSETIVPNYNLYFTDTWHLKQNLTLTYGLGYVVEMPPYEVAGNLPMVTYSDGTPFTAVSYLAQRQQAALSGKVYNPILGFETIRNVATHPKYPFDPYYGGLSPRVAVAWSPKIDAGFISKLFPSGKTVIRAGYGRTYNRVNGINLVQVPLQGIGIGQAVTCIGASASGQCLGSAGVDPTTAFRLGLDGLVAPLPGVPQSLPQPYFPGVGGNAPGTGDSKLDPSMKPGHIDQFDFTIQRELSSKTKLELGFISSRSRGEQMFYNLDSVPYMTTLNNQTFEQAYINLYNQVSGNQTIQSQPFFETAFGGPSSAYCTGFANCTAALASKQRTNILTTQFYNLWNAMNTAPGWTLGRTMLSSNPIQVTGMNMAVPWGWSYYNAGFASLRMGDWHGVTTTANLTFSRALGTGGVAQNGLVAPIDQWHPEYNYGPQPFDIKWVYSNIVYYRPPVFKGNRGFLGQVLGGWAFAPLFTASSGVPIKVTLTSSTGENAVALVPYTGGNSAHTNVVSTGVAGFAGNPSTGGSGINLFADPSAVYSSFRRWIFGVDGQSGGAGPIRGFPTWNLDLSVTKDFKVRETIGATLSFQFVNVLNHFQPANPTLNWDSPSNFGVVTGQSNVPRQMEFGLRIFF